MHVKEKISDATIKQEWKRAIRLYSRSSSLAKRVALVIADNLEKAGVTDADIDRLFPEAKIT